MRSLGVQVHLPEPQLKLMHPPSNSSSRDEPIPVVITVVIGFLPDSFIL